MTDRTLYDPRFTALSFVWDRLLSDEERGAVLCLTRQLRPDLRYALWSQLNPGEREQIIFAARQAIALGQQLAQATLLDLKHMAKDRS
jgi:hypothetical protein